MRFICLRNLWFLWFSQFSINRGSRRFLSESVFRSIIWYLYLAAEGVIIAYKTLLLPNFIVKCVLMLCLKVAFDVFTCWREEIWHRNEQIKYQRPLTSHMLFLYFMKEWLIKLSVEIVLVFFRKWRVWSLRASFFAKDCFSSFLLKGSLLHLVTEILNVVVLSSSWIPLMSCKCINYYFLSARVIWI